MLVSSTYIHFLMKQLEMTTPPLDNGVRVSDVDGLALSGTEDSDTEASDAAQPLGSILEAKPLRQRQKTTTLV
jgi:hypothetical protein